jgi:hypothetical protein
VRVLLGKGTDLKNLRNNVSVPLMTAVTDFIFSFVVVVVVFVVVFVV